MANHRQNPEGRRRGRQARKRSARGQEAQSVAEPVEGVAEPGEREQRPEEEPQVVAEEHINTTSSAGTPPPGEKESEAQSVAEPVEGVAEPGEREQRPEEESQVVAEEHINTTSSAGTPPPGEKEVPVTEKPVATQRKISQYVVSVDDATGSVVKIEKLDDKTGQRKELTQEEYAAAYGFASYAAPNYTAYTASLYDPMSSPAVQAYLKAVSDYLKAFTAKR